MACEMHLVLGISQAMLYLLYCGGAQGQDADNSLVGAGYSSDTQQITKQRCYNATISSTSGQRQNGQLQSLIPSSELERLLGLSMSIDEGYGLFSSDEKTTYFRSVREKSYSLSLHHFVSYTNNVSVQLAGSGEKALSESGAIFYNNGSNPFYGITCGDSYVSSYQQGALLTMGLVIQFRNADDKARFKEKLVSSNQTIVDVAESIRSLDMDSRKESSVSVQALQIGGQPEELLKSLRHDDTGKYYILTCSLVDVDNCISTTKDLLNYANKEFPNQFSFGDNTGLTPLGTNFAQFTPIKYIGLSAPESLVTPEVKEYRELLSCRLKENEYYQEKLDPLMNHKYPVPLAAPFINKVKMIWSKVNHNLGTLLKSHDGVTDCYSFPNKCGKVKSGMDSQMRYIIIRDLRTIKDIQYTLSTRGGVLFNNGGGTPNSWEVVANKLKPGETGEVLVNMTYIGVTPTFYSYSSYIKKPNLFFVTYKGDSVDGMVYKGTLKMQERFALADITKFENYEESKNISPFYVDLFKLQERCKFTPRL